MQLLRDLLLRRKLMLVMMLSSCVTLLVACAAWFYSDWTSSRAAQTHELALLGEIIGASAAPAIEFNQHEKIDADLCVLARRPSIRRATVFDLQGQPLSSYSSQAAEGLGHLPFRSSGEALSKGGIAAYVPIHSGSERVGTVGIECDLTELILRQIAFARAALLVLAACLLVALGLSYRLQAFISQPVLRLADTARKVSLRKDYTLRAEKLGQDELGDLTDSFNAMLSVIEERDAQLQQARATLEQQVAARTKELVEQNERLHSSMEEARAAAVAKAQFLANMSHEIRTPMNGILGMNELMLESPLDEQQKSYAEIVKSSAESLLEIINDILDFSKIEAGKLKLEAIEFDLFRTVDEVVGLLSGPARKKGLELANWIVPAIPRRLRGDPTRLRQVLTNLIGNAIKFTAHGRVALRAELVEQRERSVQVRFVIEDTGMGIGQERARKLFQPFTQVDASTTRRYGGTGLGLAISKQLVELMGGEIGLSSELGVGSTFWFTARFELLADQPRSFVLPDGVGRTRVLVAESSTAAREMLHQQLTGWGFEHEVVSDAARALSALRRAFASGKPFGLCLLDVELCTSEELLTFLRLEQAPLRPKIVLLSWAGSELSELAQGVMQVAALTKPLRPARLFDVFVEHLAEERASEAASELTPHDTLAPASETTVALRVLLAEDNAINQLVAAKILAKDGHHCEMVADGRKAVLAATSGDFDVVLMDCQMPELDGFEATDEIRRIEQRAKRPPVYVIALTANAMKGDRERCLAVGMDDYLSKPVKPDLLLGKLRQLGETLARTRAARAGEPFDVQALVRRFAGRADELAAELLERERHAHAAAKRLAHSLDATTLDAATLEAGALDAARASLAELRAALTLFSSPRLDELAHELATLCDERRLAEAPAALAALQTELARCLAYLPAAVAQARAG